MVYEGTAGARLNTAGDGIINPPFGLFDGAPGLPHMYKIVSNGVDRVLGSKEAEVPVQTGDTIICLSSGGGGFGDPEGRTPEQREWDLKNGYCT